MKSFQCFTIKCQIGYHLNEIVTSSDVKSLLLAKYMIDLIMSGNCTIAYPINNPTYPPTVPTTSSLVYART